MDVNVFEEGNFYSPNVVVEPICTCIHAYLIWEEWDYYLSNAFFYADGCFSTALSEDNTLEIKVQILSLMRYPLPSAYLSLAN